MSTSNSSPKKGHKKTNEGGKIKTETKNKLIIRAVKVVNDN